MTTARHILAAVVSVATWPVLMGLAAIAAVTAAMSVALVAIPRWIRP